jgi:hypothetical protein
MPCSGNNEHAQRLPRHELGGGRRGTPIPTTSVGPDHFTTLPTLAKALIHTHDDVRHSGRQSRKVVA